jgi:hypothetical protein
VSHTKRSTRPVITAALLILGAAIFGAAAAGRRSTEGLRGNVTGAQLFQESKPAPGAPAANPQTPSDPKTNARQQPQGPRREENKKPADSTKYSYEFTQPQFYLRHIVIEHDAAGHGKITFERLGQEPAMVEPVELSTGALGRILGLWTALQFLESNENYQSDKQFPHLGTMRLLMEQGTRKRTAEFNWTNNKEAGALASEYRRVADQAVLLFDIAIARENQPLNTPKLLDEFEMLLSRSDLSDPYQLVPLLRDIATDERLPLIARNHATRLLKKIQK